MSVKNSNDAIGNRTGDLTACEAVPQPAARPCVPQIIVLLSNYSLLFYYKYTYKALRMDVVQCNELRVGPT